MKIGYRTLKTAVGAPVAIYMAQLLGLTNFVTAGILTILCIQPSRKKSLLSATHRFSACILATIFSFIFFETIGYNPLAVGIMLALFIPVTVLLKITTGIGTSSVIILTLYSEEYMSYTFLLDQFLVITVGIGVALLLNLYMPSMEKQLKEKREKLEDYFQVILHEIALHIKNKNQNWDGKELRLAEEVLDEASEIVDLDRENHLFRNKHPFSDYFIMRKKQLERLEKMLPLVSVLTEKDAISDEIASFFESLSAAVHPGNTASLFLEQLKEIRREFDKKELPKTQEAFETKANLYRLLHEIKDYLLIKNTFKKSDVKNVHKKKTGAT